MDTAELLRRLRDVQREYRDERPGEMLGDSALAELIADIEKEAKPPVYGLYGGG